MSRAWPALLLGAALAPLVTWFPMLAHRFPVLGLPAYPPAEGIDLWHGQTFWLTAMLAMACLVVARDRWLAAALVAVSITTWLRGATMDVTHSVVLAIGCLLLGVARTIPERWDHHIRWLLVALGGFQIAYVLQQHLGYDVLWGPWFGGQLNPHLQPLGTFGSVNGTSVYIALLAPLMPVWLMVAAVLVVWWGHSLGAIAAIIAGLCTRALVLGRVNRRAMASTVIATLLLTAGAAWKLAPDTGMLRETNAARLDIWRFALADFVTHPGAVVTGYGLGGWSREIPARQFQSHHVPTGEFWREAHNEYLQWLLETGLIGFALFGLWLRDHWRMFLHPRWGPSLVALAVSCVTWHTFHIVSSALVGILLVGLATREEAPCAA